MRKVGERLFFLRVSKELFDKRKKMEIIEFEVRRANKSSYYATQIGEDIAYRFRQSNDEYVDRTSTFGYHLSYIFLSEDKEEAEEIYRTILAEDERRFKLIDYIESSINEIHNLKDEKLLEIALALGAKEEEFEMKEIKA